ADNAEGPGLGALVVERSEGAVVVDLLHGAGAAVAAVALVAQQVAVDRTIGVVPDLRRDRRHDRTGHAGDPSPGRLSVLVVQRGERAVEVALANVAGGPVAAVGLVAGEVAVDRAGEVGPDLRTDRRHDRAGHRA